MSAKPTRAPAARSSAFLALALAIAHPRGGPDRAATDAAGSSAGFHLVGRRRKDRVSKRLSALRSAVRLRLHPAAAITDPLRHRSLPAALPSFPRRGLRRGCHRDHPARDRQLLLLLRAAEHVSPPEALELHAAQRRAREPLHPLRCAVQRRPVRVSRSRRDPLVPDLGSKRSRRPQLRLVRRSLPLRVRAAYGRNGRSRLSSHRLLQRAAGRAIRRRPDCEPVDPAHPPEQQAPRLGRHPLRGPWVPACVLLGARLSRRQ
jgi:hypothetical protein